MLETFCTSRQMQRKEWTCVLPMGSVEFVLAPQHVTSYDPETTTKEDLYYWRKINWRKQTRKQPRVHDEPNEVGNETKDKDINPFRTLPCASIWCIVKLYSAYLL